MRRFSVLFIALLLVVTWTAAASADKTRLKHVSTSYTDSSEVGLKYPEGVACSDPYLYVADTGNSRLLRYTDKDDALLVDKVFPLGNIAPLQVQVNSKSEIYVLDGKDRKIVNLDSGGNPKTTFSFSGVPGKGKIVPKSFRIDEKDNLYVLDVFSGRVLVVDGQGAYQSHLPFPENYGFFSDLALDGRGNIYLLDSVDVVVYRSTGGGEFKPLATDIKSYMNFPTSMVVRSDGRMFLVDQYGSGVVQLAPDGTFAGRKIAMGWDNGFLFYPAQACFSRGGKLLIADRNNNRVQLFSLID